MKKPEIEKLYHQHCRLKLKSGKEIFGVIWEEKLNSEPRIFFASLGDLLKQQSPNIAQTINPEEIIYAEAIVN
jgi:hypothetical protein